MLEVSPSLILASFGSATVASLLLFGLVVPLRPRTHVSRWFLYAALVSSLWAFALTAIVWSGESLVGWAVALDALHLAAWVVFVVVLAGSLGIAGSDRAASTLRFVVLALSVVIVAANLPSIGDLLQPKARFSLVLMLPLAGLLGLEQAFRNSTYDEQRFLKPLVIGIGAIFALDVFVYSQSLLFGAISPLSWALRGFANAAVVPLLVVAAKRQPSWGSELFVSRQVVYYSTTFMAVGAYLLVMAAGGYVIGASGLAWGLALQVVFLVLAGGFLSVILFSRALRNRLRVFIAKHFYRNRYDYREEWLRLMHTLDDAQHTHSLGDRCVKALAEVIGSDRGRLWLLNAETGAFEPAASWREAPASFRLTNEDAMVKFLRERRWVVDMHEYVQDPEKYANAFAGTTYTEERAAIYVPMMHGNALVAVLQLERPPGIGELSFEDHDLLKTAGQQAAIHLIQERDREALAETRQFEAFSKLTAFLMHDLKNLIAQQELVVANAKRFRDRPEFIDDAMQTIDGSVRRMRGVLERLQADGPPSQAARVDLARLLEEIVAGCSDREPRPRAEIASGPIWVNANRERLAMAITHAVRNAQDATVPTGLILLRAQRLHDQAVIEVEDTGVGMDEDFVSNHLFKPFESTKGAKGMGIGAYQIRETFRAAGGDATVTSEVGVGTVVRMTLPAVPSKGMAAASSPGA